VSSEPGSVRFTLWLAEDELAAIAALADELGSSKNYVVRTYVRVLQGRPAPRWARELVELAARRLAA
jgi:hypothetical protein